MDSGQSAALHRRRRRRQQARSDRARCARRRALAPARADAERRLRGDDRGDPQAWSPVAEAELGLSGASVGLGTPGTATPEGLIKNANSTCLNGRPLRARPRSARCSGRCASPTTPTAWRCRRRATAPAPARRLVFARHPRHRRRRRHRGARPRARRAATAWPANGATTRCPGRGRTSPPACYCGRRGCIETWLSGPALARDHAAHGGDPIDAAQIDARARAGDAACAASLARYESTPRASACRGDQPARPARDRARRRPVAHRAALRQRAGVVGRARLRRRRRRGAAHTARAEPARRRLGRARCGAAVARAAYICRNWCT